MFQEGIECACASALKLHKPLPSWQKTELFSFLFFPPPFFLFELINVFISCSFPVVEKKGSKHPELRNSLLLGLGKHFQCITDMCAC